MLRAMSRFAVIAVVIACGNGSKPAAEQQKTPAAEEKIAVPGATKGAVGAAPETGGAPTGGRGGWTTNPLVEYYIVDSWGNWRPPGGEGSVGATVMSDGGTYDLYKIPRSGANIQGNGAFTQYWSVRKEKKPVNGSTTSGAITVANHFNAWKNNGMPMGSLYEVSLSVEGYQSAGKAEVRLSIR